MNNIWDEDEDDFDNLLTDIDLDNPIPDKADNAWAAAVIAGFPTETSNFTPSPPIKKIRGNEQEMKCRNESNPILKMRKSPILPKTSTEKTAIKVPSNSLFQVTARRTTKPSTENVTISVEKLSSAEKSKIAERVVALFFGEQPPTMALLNYNQSLPQWDILQDPFSYEEHMDINIDGILYYVNYIKLEKKGIKYFFKLLICPTEEAKASANLTLELGEKIYYFRIHMEIKIPKKLEWILHKNLIDSSSLFLVCPRNDLIFSRK